MQPEDLVGQVLGHYRVKRPIGYGGMATVFLAEDINLNREIALKVFWPRAGETQDFLRRFAREARVLAQLDHPNILPVYDYGEQGELAFLVTPYMSGGTLKEVLQKRKALPPSEAIQLISQVLPALQYAHDHNLIHRDIKPGNLLFKADGSLVLADFGLVKVVEGEKHEGISLHTLSESGQSIAGTPEYMAPEQIEGKPIAASDIYAIGIVLYEMVTGTRPFSGESLFSVLMKHVNETPRPPRELNPYVSPQLDAAIQRAMIKDPQKRFARPADFQQALQRSGNPTSNPGITPLPDTNTPFVQSQRQLLNEHNATLAASWSQASVPAGADQPAYTANMHSQGPFVPNASGPEQPAGISPWSAVQQHAQPGSMTSMPQLSSQGWAQHGVPASTPMQPQTRTRHSRVPLVVLVILFLLLAGLVASLFLTPLGATFLGTHAPGTQTPGGGTPVSSTTVVARGGHTPAPGNTQTMPSTSTTCPADGSGRPATLAPLHAGQNATIVYIVNESDASGNATFGTIKIFNTVSGKKTELTKASSTRVTEAQVSNDGEWVLFAALVKNRSELRIVRLDGQGLQTLLCAPEGMTIRGSQWSIDQKYVIFDEFPQSGGAPSVDLLNVQSGALQVEVAPSVTGTALLPRTWLDFQHVLMTGIIPASDAPPQNIYQLDITKGPNQNMSDITQVFTFAQPCWDFDSSYDAQTLFITQCTPAQPAGSSTIMQRPVGGGNPTTILNSSTLAFNTVRVIDHKSTTILAIASDTSPGTSSGDPIHDGLYLLKTSGTTPLRLTNTSSGEISRLNAYSQYYWSNVSRDVRLYALETQTPDKNIYALSYGQLDGHAPITFASLSDGTVMSIAGWTTT